MEARVDPPEVASTHVSPMDGLRTPFRCSELAHFEVAKTGSSWETKAHFGLQATAPLLASRKNQVFPPILKKDRRDRTPGLIPGIATAMN